MQSPITPTVGRKVWFFADHMQVEPFDATVVAVNSDQSVNLHVAMPDSAQVGFYASVLYAENFPHYQWMPYQLTQAKSTTTPNTPAAA